MTHRSVTHDTFALTCRYEAPPARVFAAWADADARRRWGAPFAGAALEHEAADFSVGGEDVAICVVDGEPAARVVTRYLDIVPERRIVLSEVIESDGRTEGVSLVSVEMAPEGDGTALTVTIQTAALDGSGLEGGVREGWAHSLDALGLEVREPARA